DKKNLESEVKLKSTEMEYLKKTESELNEMKSDVKTKSEEIQNLKISEAKLDSQLAVSKRRMSQLEDENKSKSTMIKNLNIVMSQDVRKILEKVKTTSINMRSIHNMTFMTLSERFTQISKLTSSNVYSQWTELAGVKWRFELLRGDDYLHVDVDADKCCSAFVELQLISQKNENIVHCKNLTNNEGYWKFNSFISFKDLFDEEKGYVKDDSIIVLAVVKVFPAEIDHFKELQKSWMLESQDNKKNLESEAQLKSTEIEHFKELQKIWKINVAVSDNRISQLEEEKKSKSAKIDNLNLEISEGVRKILEKAETTSIDLRSLHKKNSEMTLRARFTEVSKLTSTRVYSKWIEFTGLHWHV
ncbi:hypothetical protein PENTCL1PPCAC_21249, partial [Pristionchus entomophagus]